MPFKITHVWLPVVGRRRLVGVGVNYAMVIYRSIGYLPFAIVGLFGLAGFEAGYRVLV